VKEDGGQPRRQGGRIGWGWSGKVRGLVGRQTPGRSAGDAGEFTESSRYWARRTMIPAAACWPTCHAGIRSPPDP